MKTALPEELEIWRLAKAQVQELEQLLSATAIAAEAEITKPMLASSAAVVESIAEGYKRPGNNVFQKNFLVIAKGFNGEFRIQLQQCLERKQMDPEKFTALYNRNVALGETIAASIRELQGRTMKNELSADTSTTSFHPDNKIIH